MLLPQVGLLVATDAGGVRLPGQARTDPLLLVSRRADGRRRVDRRRADSRWALVRGEFRELAREILGSGLHQVTPALRPSRRNAIRRSKRGRVREVSRVLRWTGRRDQSGSTGAAAVLPRIGPSSARAVRA